MNTNIFIEKAVSSVPDDIGLVYGESRYTYRQIFEEINKLTNALLGLGCKKGTRVGTLAGNCPESIFLYYAASRIDAVYTAFDYTETKENIAGMINCIQPELLFVDNNYINTSISIRSMIPCVKMFISIGKHHASYLNYSTLVSRASDDYYCCSNDENDPTAILFTSGTTGKRKAVAFSHINFIRQVLNRSNPLKPRQTSLTIHPFSHILGFQAITSAFYDCNRLVLVNVFDAESNLKTIEKEKVTQITLNPAKLAKLLACPYLEKADLSSLDNIRYGGDTAHSALVLQAIKKLPNVNLMNVYGLTETTYDIAGLDAEDHNILSIDNDNSTKIIRLGSIGRPFKPSKIIIVDNDGSELPPGEIGELLVHTDSYMIGYVSPETHEIIPENNYWFHTDDMGYKDEDGYIYLIGHKVNTLLNRGNTQSPQFSSDFMIYPCVTNKDIPISSNESGLEFIQNFINQNTYIKFLHFLRTLYEAESIEQLISIYLNSISDFIPGSFFGIHPQNTHSMAFADANNESLKWDIPYYDTLTINKTFINTEDSEISPAALEENALLQDFFEKIKPDHLILTPLYDSDRNLMGIMSFGRFGKNWSFSSYEQNLILQISNNICVAFSKLTERERLIRENTLMQNILYVSGIPVIVTTSEGKIIYKNQYSHILLERDQSSNTSGELMSNIKANISALSEYDDNTFPRSITSHYISDNVDYVLKTVEIEFSPAAFITIISSDETEEQNFDYLGDLVTEQEKSVITLVSAGASNAVIADRLHISVNTVKYHLKNIFQKFNVTTRTELLTKVYAFKRDNSINTE